MADPLQQLGISRRPADVLFGSPNMAGGTAAGWTRAAVEQDEADKALRDEELAREDERAARARSRQAEQAMDRVLAVKEPTAREKMLGEDPTVVGSKRYGEFENYQKAQPSYADKTLYNHVATQYKDPEALRVLNDHYNAGKGLWEGKMAADELLAGREFEGKLAALGMPRAEAESIRKQYGTSPAVFEEQAYKLNEKKKMMEGDLFRDDIEGRALLHQLKLLDAQAAFELKKEGQVSDTTEAEQAQVRSRVMSKYKQLQSPKPGAPGAAPAGEGTVLRPAANSLAPATSQVVEAAKAAEQGVATPAPEAPTSKLSDLDQLSGVVSDPAIPVEDKRVAYNKMQELAASAKPPRFSNLTEIAKFKEGVKKKLDDAQFELDTHHLKGQWADAWTAQKNSVGQAIADMSKDLGIDEDAIIGALATKAPEDGGIPEPQVVPNSLIPEEMRSSDPRERATGRRYVKDLLASYIARQNGRAPSEANYQNELQSRANSDLSNWEGDPVRGFSDVEKKGLARMGAVGKFTQEDVLKRLLEERMPKTNAAAPEAATPSGAVKTSSGNTAVLKSTR